VRIVSNNNNLIKLQGRFYVVQFSDSLYLISQRFGINVSDLLSFNDQLGGSNVIFPGEVLYIPEPTATTLRKAAAKPKRTKK
jgi:LysM repeat protein